MSNLCWFQNADPTLILNLKKGAKIAHPDFPMIDRYEIPKLYNH